MERFGYSNCFVKHGSVEQLEKEYGLEPENIFRNIVQNVKTKKFQNVKTKKFQNVKIEKNI